MIRRRWAIAVALLALAVFVWVAAEWGRGETAEFDAAARRFVQSIASPALTMVMRGFSIFGESQALALIVAIGALWFYRVGRLRAALLLIIAVAGAGLLDGLLKVLFHRLRPDPFFHIQLPNSYSFPSGHAFACSSLCGALAGLLAAAEPRRRVRIALWIAAALVAAAIGFSRVYLGVHYATDVIGGYAAGTLWLLLVAALARAIQSH